MNTDFDLDAKIKSKKRTIKDLAEYIKINPGTKPNYSLFLGAGASVTSGIRTASDLVDEWSKEIYERLSSCKYPSKEEAIEWFSKKHADWFEPSNEYSSLFEKKFDLASQRRRFVEIQVDKKLPSIGYAYLVDLFENNFFDTVFTTNFDDLINEAFYQFSSNRPLLCAHDSSIKGISISSARPKIIKLHGDYLFDSIKSSLRETENLEVNTREKLVDFAKEYGIIFIGYAGNDNSIMEVLKFLLKQSDYLKNGIYWCKRKGDVFSADLIKLLNHERVYWVEIDGFDEFVAELTHNLGVRLSLGGNQKSTKREKMINNFILDEYELAKNEVINSDVKKLKKHVFTQDISSLINELSGEDVNDAKIHESEFKKLLAIDSLIKNKSYKQAETEILKNLEREPSEILNVKYVQRLINIYSENKETKKAIEYSERLISLGPNNVAFHITKARQLPKLKERISYLRECLARFKYSCSLRNYLADIADDYSDENDGCDFSYNDIECWINESLTLDRSLDNKAWFIKFDAIINKHSGVIDKKDENLELQKLLDDMEVINPQHENFLTLKSNFIQRKKDLKSIDDFICELNEIYSISPVRKKKYVLNILSKLHLHLNDLQESVDFDFKTIASSFLDKYESEKHGDNLTSYLLFKSIFAIGQNKDIQEGIRLGKLALEAKWRASHLTSIVNILCIDKNNISFIRDSVISSGSEVVSSSLARVKAELYVYEGLFSDAIKVIDECYEVGKIGVSEFLLSKSYILLKGNMNEEVIGFIDSKVHSIKNVETKNVLIINREVAKKALGRDLKDNELRSVISHAQSKGHQAMCAFYLLGENKPAGRILKNSIEKDYFNYFLIKEWPAVLSQELEAFASYDIVA